MKKYYQGKPLKQNKAEFKKGKRDEWLDFLALKGFFDQKIPLEMVVIGRRKSKK